ncbi:MAG: 2,3,4,5-tetrahydropyridine-2,6-dicarboxylate N-succinyltransferase [Bacteroidota bacterium]
MIDNSYFYRLIKSIIDMPTTKELFKAHVAQIENKENYQKPIAFALGIRRTKGDKTLDVFYPHINFNTAFGTAALLLETTQYSANTNGFVSVSKAQLAQVFDQFKAFHDEMELHPNIGLVKNLLDAPAVNHAYYQLDIIAYFFFENESAVASTEEGYFKLQCLSQLHVKPHQIKLDGVFGKLNNIAWTNYGPILTAHLSAEKMRHLFLGQELVVSHVDKFPYMVNYTIQDGVRVAAGSQVRLGAHLASGTTVMPAGYVNFNAGTLGTAMVEGRISGGVVVGDNTDIGGGASIMGTLSGGNKNVISLGEKCLMGANAGTGISLGFGCTIEAGLYITASAKIHLYDGNNKPVNLEGKPVAEGENVVKAMALNGKDKLLFIRNSETGTVICKPNPKTIELNASLHV